MKSQAYNYSSRIGNISLSSSQRSYLDNMHDTTHSIIPYLREYETSNSLKPANLSIDVYGHLIFAERQVFAESYAEKPIGPRILVLQQLYIDSLYRSTVK